MVLVYPFHNALGNAGCGIQGYKVRIVMVCIGTRFIDSIELQNQRRETNYQQLSDPVKEILLDQYKFADSFVKSILSVIVFLLSFWNH
mmetsp:Transcript_17563/g.34982  ORF Transcript_17563/g.34982 Transcript_17563/m.34982 type:complete len:88 (-) Transcript_17563:4822-5085(-)